MADHLDELLDAIAARAHPPEPPLAFLRAVRRCRRRRRLTRAGAAGVLLVVTIGVSAILLPAARGPRGRPQRFGGTIPDTSVLALARANMDRDPEHLLLPDDAGGDGDEPLRLGLRWEFEQVARWIGP